MALSRSLLWAASPWAILSLWSSSAISSAEGTWGVSLDSELASDPFAISFGSEEEPWVSSSILSALEAEPGPLAPSSSSVTEWMFTMESLLLFLALAASASASFSSSSSSVVTQSSSLRPFASSLEVSSSERSPHLSSPLLALFSE